MPDTVADALIARKSKDGWGLQEPSTIRLVSVVMAKRKPKDKAAVQVEPYEHHDVDQPSRPEVGTQARFTLKKPPQTYRYDSSLSPSLEWDGQNAAREEAEVLISQILNAASVEEAKVAAEKLQRMSGPFLNWAG